MFNKKIWKKIEQIKRYIYDENKAIHGELCELMEKIYFNRKRIEDLERDSLLKGNIVFCEECGVAVKADKAKEVFIGRYLNGSAGDVEYYCDRHAPKYDKVIESDDKNYYFYKNNVEVDKKGRIKKSKK